MPDGFKVQWNGDAIAARFEQKFRKKLYACGLIIQRRAKVLLSVAGTGGGTNGRRRVYGANPSAPGDPPHKQTGRLRASVAVEMRPMAVRVGTNVKYGRWLELGTRKMKARPWLRRALAESKPQVEAVMAAP